MLFSQTPLDNYINESIEAPSTPLVTTTINNLPNSKSTLQKGDYILAVKVQQRTNNNGLVTDASRSDYISKPTTPSISVLAIQTMNNGKILNIKLTSQSHGNTTLIHVHKHSKSTVENALQLPTKVSDQTPVQDDIYGPMADDIILYYQCQHQHIYLLYFDTWVPASICFVLVCTACISLPLFSVWVGLHLESEGLFCFPLYILRI